MTNPQLEMAVLVVDPGLGALRTTEDGAVVGLDLAPGVSEAIEALRARRVRVALAVPEAGPGAPCTRLAIAGFDGPAWRVRGAPRTWIEACVRDLGGPSARPAAVVLASIDPALRDAAHELGLRAAPHAQVAAWLAAGREPRFVRIEAARDQLPCAGELVPCFVEPGARWVVWGMVPADAIDALGRSVASLEVLRLDPARVEPVLLQLEVPRGARQAASSPPHAVWSNGRVALLAVPAVELDAVERLAARRHGAIRRAIPSLALLDPPASSWRSARLPTAALGRAVQPGRRAPAPSGFAGPTAATVTSDVSRYAGAAPLDATGAIASRHVRHPDNARAVQAILADLAAVGYQPYTHTFTYQGKVLSSVIADLPGTGLAALPGPPLAALRSAVRAPDAAPELVASLARELGASWVRGE
ncbi:MAG TPA: hypothetical protein VFT22_04745, partial [Kofleriaceae bacterium]|nr:hypothetical protein [Kofleriaceae bacterium]